MKLLQFYIFWEFFFLVIVEFLDYFIIGMYLFIFEGFCLRCYFEFFLFVKVMDFLIIQGWYCVCRMIIEQIFVFIKWENVGF